MAPRHARPTRAQARAGVFALQPQLAGPSRRLDPVRPYARGRVRPTARQRALHAAKAMLATAALFGGAAVVGVVAGDSTLALWSTATPVPAGTVTSGTVGLQVNGTLPAITAALPGEVYDYAFQVENTGDVDLVVVPTLAVAYADWELRVLIQGTGYACPDLSGYPAVGTTPNELIPNVVVAAGEDEMQLCVEITALTTALPTDTVEFELLLDGTQDL